MTRSIMGVDPGSRAMGVACLSIEESPRVLHVTVIRPQGEKLIDRIGMLFESFMALLVEWKPSMAAVEDIFVQKHPRSALILGHARGVALSALVSREVPVFEYSPRYVKKMVAGDGGADKEAVRDMLKWRVAGVPEALALDASDALALALCHLYHSQSAADGTYTPARRRRTGRWRL